MNDVRFFPASGVSRNQLVQGLRVIFYEVYAIYYTYNETELTIIRVLHGARDAINLTKLGRFLT
jgi:plasmid stabilization system protein ParE